jgi:hypothetical protein
MTFTCASLETALRDAEPEALSAARAHAATCPGCHKRLEAWDALAEAAPSLRRSWQSPELWPRIHQALAEESQRRGRRSSVLGWLPRLAALAAAIVVVALALVSRREPAPTPAPGESERRLLTERALAEVERSEAEYVASIDRLARVAGPLLERPDSPLLASYREKLDLLDAAIAECRGQIERNRYNAHLRRELLSIYQEKQRTLRQIMEERT